MAHIITTTMATLLRTPALSGLASRRPAAPAPAGLPLLRKASTVRAARATPAVAMSFGASPIVHVSHRTLGRQPLNVRAQAASTPAPAPAAAPKPAFKWGANMRDLGMCVAIATILWFVPPPAGVTLKAWHLLSIFIGTIVGIITTPLPLGAVAVLGLGAAMLTKVLSFAEAFSAFASEIP